jgi:hypothetical protein
MFRRNLSLTSSGAEDYTNREAGGKQRLLRVCTVLNNERFVARKRGTYEIYECSASCPITERQIFKQDLNFPN